MCTLISNGRKFSFRPSKSKEFVMNRMIYIVGLIVIVLFILGYVGIR
jgi:hypothetical protein